MGNPNIEDPFASAGIINPLAPKEGAGRITRGEFIAKWLTFLVALKSTNILAQWADLPKTYDAIMDALSKGQLTYEQLLEIWKTNLTNFTDEQRKVLSGELAKLKMAKDKTVVKTTSQPPINESKEDKEKRLQEEKLEKLQSASVKSLSSVFLDPKKWWILPGKTDKVKIKKVGAKGIHIEFDDQKSKELNREGGAGFEAMLAPGSYQIKIVSTWNPIVVYTYNAAGATIGPDGNVIEKGSGKRGLTLLSDVENTLIVPPNCRKVLFTGSVTPLNTSLTVSDFNASVTDKRVAQQ